MEEVGRVTGMNYEEAAERHNITQIAPDSENYRNHYKRLGKDKEYRKNGKQQYPQKLKNSNGRLNISCLRPLQKNCR